MPPQTLSGGVADQIIERTEGTGSQTRDRSGGTGTTGEGSGHGAHNIRRAFEQGDGAARVTFPDPSFEATGWAEGQEPGSRHRADSTDGESTKGGARSAHCFAVMSGKTAFASGARPYCPALPAYCCASASTSVL